MGQVILTLYLAAAMVVTGVGNFETDFLIDRYWHWANEGARQAGLGAETTVATYRIEQLHPTCPVGFYGCGDCPTQAGVAVAISSYNSRVNRFCTWNETRKKANAIWNNQIGVHKQYVGGGGGGAHSWFGCPPLLTTYLGADPDGCPCVYDRFDPTCG